MEGAPQLNDNESFQRENELQKLHERFKEFIKDQQIKVGESVKKGVISTPEEHKPNRSDLEEAREIIQDFLLHNEYPFVTVSKKRLGEILEKGFLNEKPTQYDKSIKAIIGTIGTEPFLPDEQERYVLRIKASPEKVDPRFTGKGNIFNGVVRIKGPVSVSDIDIVENKKEANPSDNL